MHTRTKMFVLASSLAASACGGPEELGTTEDELTTIISHCASGEDPNAIINPSLGFENLYVREAANINNSCRDTTIVDFDVPQGQIFEFWSTTTYPTANTVGKCNDSYIHMRLLRRSGSSWVEEDSSYVYADWHFDFTHPNFGYCVPPRVESRNWLPLSNKYRVRARAYRHDGTYSKMIIGLTN
jgi:hypothetical protein